MGVEGIFLLEPLMELVETAFFTASIRDEIPVSLILVGPSGSAKSKLIRSYQCEQMVVTDSITSQGLWEIAQRDSKNEKRLILLPDINPTLSRRPSTTNSTIGNLLSITGDGTVRIDDGRGEKVCKHLPMGLVTACTPEIYHQHSRKWYALGLSRRVIPIFYKYTSETVAKLQRLVRDGKIHASFGAARQFELPPLCKPALNATPPLELEMLSTYLSQHLGKLGYFHKGIKKWQMKEVVPISPHVTIRTLAMAHALRRKSMKVEQPEIDFITSFISFTDPETPRQI